MNTDNKEWYEKDGIIYLSVTSRGLTGQEWLDSFSKLEIETNKGFTYHLNPENFDYRLNCSEKFKATSGVVYNVVIVRAENISSVKRGRTTLKTRRVVARMAGPALDVVENAEVFCLLAEKFSAKEFRKMGLNHIVGINKSIVEIYDGTGDYPAQLFRMLFNRSKKRLDVDNDNLTRLTYGKGVGFVFISPEADSSS